MKHRDFCRFHKKGFCIGNPLFYTDPLFMWKSKVSHPLLAFERFSRSQIFLTVAKKKLCFVVFYRIQFHNQCPYDKARFTLFTTACSLQTEQCMVLVCLLNWSQCLFSPVSLKVHQDSQNFLLAMYTCPRQYWQTQPMQLSVNSFLD